jgi:hypothetical protein
MAITMINGFGTFPVAGDYLVMLGASGGGTSTYTRVTGRYGGYALRYANSNNYADASYVGRMTVPFTGTAVSMGIAINHVEAWATRSDHQFGMSLMRSSSDLYQAVRMGTGTANAYSDTGGATAWTVVDSSVTGLGWHWWNWVFTYASSGGICRLYRDGTLIAQADGNTTNYYGAPTEFRIYLGSNPGSAKADFADLVVKNDATTIADTVVVSLFPDGTSAAGLTGSDSDQVNNHLLVNENPTYDATAYVGSATAGATDTYTLANLAVTPSAIQAVQASARAFKSDAGAKTAATLINGTQGTAIDPGGSKTLYQLALTNPSGGAAWDTASVNAMTMGVRVVS